MEIRELQKAYNACEEDLAGHWVEPELLELVMATARYILANSASTGPGATSAPDNAYIPLKACAQQVKVVSMRTYLKWLSTRPDFARKCARKINGAWHFFPEMVLDYVHKMPLYRNRLALISGN